MLGALTVGISELNSYMKKAYQMLLEYKLWIHISCTKYARLIAGRFRYEFVFLYICFFRAAVLSVVGNVCNLCAYSIMESYLYGKLFTLWVRICYVVSDAVGKQTSII